MPASKTQLHPITWDDETVARFWDLASHHPAHVENYFSRQVGPAITVLLDRLGVLRGRVLDYGCGPGFLLEHLLAAGVDCEGFDFSPESVDGVNERFAGHSNWRGATCSTSSRLPYDDQAFDLIVCLETVEHVLPARLDAFLEELRRVLKPKTGRLLLTTPNAEDLDRSTIFCPVCCTAFHRYQHVRALDRHTLAKLMEEHGYQTELCQSIIFHRLQSPLWPGIANLNLRRLARMTTATACRILDRLPLRAPLGGFWLRQFCGHGNNLFWVGSAKET